MVVVCGHHFLPSKAQERSAVTLGFERKELALVPSLPFAVPPFAEYYVPESPSSLACRITSIALHRFMKVPLLSFFLSAYLTAQWLWAQEGTMCMPV